MSKTPLATFRHKDVYSNTCRRWEVTRVGLYISAIRWSIVVKWSVFDGKLIGLTHTIIIFERKMWWNIFCIYFLFHEKLFLWTPCIWKGKKERRGECIHAYHSRSQFLCQGHLSNVHCNYLHTNKNADFYRPFSPC